MVCLLQPQRSLTPQTPLCTPVVFSFLSGCAASNRPVFQKPPFILLVCSEQTAVLRRTRVKQGEGDGDEVNSCARRRLWGGGALGKERRPEQLCPVPLPGRPPALRPRGWRFLQVNACAVDSEVFYIGC